MLTCVLLLFVFFFFFFKQKTAYEMRISDWSSDVCSSDLLLRLRRSYYESFAMAARGDPENCLKPYHRRSDVGTRHSFRHGQSGTVQLPQPDDTYCHRLSGRRRFGPSLAIACSEAAGVAWPARSEEHTSELQSLMRISYA